jgi:hypothetical protein
MASSVSASAAAGRCGCGVWVQSRLGQACNEEAFRHFLSMERNRWRRSGRAFVLIVIRLRQAEGTITGIEAAIAGKMFPSLWQTLRSTDQVGWFREGRAIGALLGDACNGNPAALCEKLRSSLNSALPPDLGAGLYIRAFRVPSDRNHSA